MWLSANLVIATFSLGALGITVFGLAFGQAVLVIIFFSILGGFPWHFFMFWINFRIKTNVIIEISYW